MNSPVVTIRVRPVTLSLLNTVPLRRVSEFQVLDGIVVWGDPDVVVPSSRYFLPLAWYRMGCPVKWENSSPYCPSTRCSRGSYLPSWLVSCLRGVDIKESLPALARGCHERLSFAFDDPLGSSSGFVDVRHSWR